jgi:protein phosphatase PTC7
LIRNGRSIFKSPVQQHQFNIPFQLESGGSDPPSSAEVFALQVAAGDVLVAGTDGLFDNLYDNEVMGIVIHSTRAGLVPQVTAQKIAALARLRAEDCNRQTPFSTAAQEAGFRFYGGKMDDITVIVSYVIKARFLASLVNSGLN